MNLDSPFESGQHVLICLDDPESGGTLGYYGTIVRVLGKSKAQFPDQPHLWEYRVSVFGRKEKINVSGQMLLATGIVDSAEFEQNLEGKITFDARPGSDNVELSGSYRLPSRGATYFVFRKTDTPVATYKLEMQLDTNRPESILLYDVPRNVTLNADYVLTAIRALLGAGG